MPLMTSPSDFTSLRMFGNEGFDVSDLQAALFHPLDIERFEAEHPEIFQKVPLAQSPERHEELEAQLAEARKENVSLRAWNKKIHDADILVCKTNTEMKQQVAELEAQLAQAHQDNERLAQEVESLKAEVQITLPRTAPACEAAQEKQVSHWKRYAITMAKVAYQCGVEDRKNVIRSSFEDLAVTHGGLSQTAISRLREALPEVAKKTPGAPSQG